MNDWQDFPKISLKLEEILHKIRHRIEELEIRNPYTAQILCKLIPASCHFARDLQLFGHTFFRIPPLCKLNPLYASLMILRFRALTFISEFSEKNAH